MGCVKRIQSDFPHETSQRLLINGSEVEWVSKTQPGGGIDPDKRYLPHTIAHELGHVAGLAHSPGMNEIMYSTLDEGVVVTLSENDESAMKSIYKSHTKH